MNKDFGTGDFVIECFIPAGNALLGVEGLKPPPLIAENEWTNIEVKRVSKRTFIHTSEKIDGVLFVVTLQYDEAGNLEEKQMIRADLVKG